MARWLFARSGKEKTKFDINSLWRVAGWGSAAAIALASVALAQRSDSGAQRLLLALAHPMALDGGGSTSQPIQVARNETAAGPDLGVETRRLNDAVRTLTQDRDRLASRVAVLERNLTDMTGSIKQLRAEQDRAGSPPGVGASLPTGPAGTTSPPAMADKPPPSVSAPQTIAASPAPPSTPAAAPATNAVPVPAARPAVPANPTRVASLPPTQAPAAAVPHGARIGIEIGSATTFAAAGTLWNTINSKHGGVLGGLRPAIVAHVDRNTRVTRYHVVAGPVINARAAENLCSGLIAAGQACQPAPYTGQ